MKSINWDNVSTNNEVIELIKQRIEIENKIRSIEEMALLKYELEVLSIPD